MAREPVAHEWDGALRAYSQDDTATLVGYAEALCADAKEGQHYATRAFAAERMLLIARILADRERKAQQRARRFELALEKQKPPAVAIEPEKGVVR